MRQHKKRFGILHWVVTTQAAREINYQEQFVSE